MTEIQELEEKLKEVQRESESWYNKYKDLEKENRLLGERCHQLLKDKGYLTDKIADIKANCDLAIEGRDIKIMELERENADLKETIADIEKNFRICESNADTYYDQLTKAKDLLRMCQNTYFRDPELKIKVEHFLQEIEE